MKRIFDIIFALIGLVLLSPLFVLLIVLIKVDSKGGAFFKQVRIGQYGHPFGLYKFRSMYIDSASKGLLTVGFKDPRITRFGYYLRKYKLDELPQLINVLMGNMSFVGPRPEVERYVKLYNQKQKGVLSVKPGITDWASIEFKNENEVLAAHADPEQAYIDIVMPRKLYLNQEYVKKQSMFLDIKIIIKTIIAIIK